MSSAASFAPGVELQPPPAPAPALRYSPEDGAAGAEQKRRSADEPAASASSLPNPTHRSASLPALHTGESLRGGAALQRGMELAATSAQEPLSAPPDQRAGSSCKAAALGGSGEPPSASSSSTGTGQLSPRSLAALYAIPPRKNGFELPLHPSQLTVWFALAGSVTIYAALVLPFIPDDASDGGGRTTEFWVCIFLYVGLFVLGFPAYLAVQGSDPRLTPAESAPYAQQQQQQTPQNGQPRNPHAHLQARVCDKCQLWMGPRTKHCHLCRKCIDGFDHHCIYLNTCIGRKNYFSFMWMLSCLVALLVLQLYESISLMVRAANGGSSNAALSSLLSSSALGGARAFVPLLAALSLLPLVFLLFIASLWAFHLYLILIRGQTTYEWIMERRKKQSDKEAAREQAERMARRASSVSSLSKAQVEAEWQAEREAERKRRATMQQQQQQQQHPGRAGRASSMPMAGVRSATTAGGAPTRSNSNATTAAAMSSAGPNSARTTMSQSSGAAGTTTSSTPRHQQAAVHLGDIAVAVDNGDGEERKQQRQQQQEQQAPLGQELPAAVRALAQMEEDADPNHVSPRAVRFHFGSPISGSGSSSSSADSQLLPSSENASPEVTAAAGAAAAAQNPSQPTAAPASAGSGHVAAASSSSSVPLPIMRDHTLPSSAAQRRDESLAAESANPLWFGPPAPPHHSKQAALQRADEEGPDVEAAATEKKRGDSDEDDDDEAAQHAGTYLLPVPPSYEQHDAQQRALAVPAAAPAVKEPAAGSDQV